MRKRKPTKADLERQVKELKAGLIINGAHAFKELDKVSSIHLMGSGVIVELTVLGGRAVEPFMLRDGLGMKTIEALKEDILRSQKVAMLFGVKDDETSNVQEG